VDNGTSRATRTMDIFTQAINVAIVAEMQKPQEIPAAFV
jgi:hypothetical protein